MRTKIFNYELNLSEARLQLLEKLSGIFDDEEMILGVIVDAKHDDDARALIKFLDTEEGKSEEQVILEALDLSLKRKEKSSNRP